MQPAQPAITVVGFYRLSMLDEELRAQLWRYYFGGNAVRDRSTRVQDFVRNCIPLVLLELLLDGLDERFSLADFTQEMPEAPRKHWQAAYNEVILATSGSEVLTRGLGSASGWRGGRLAFYFHFYDPEQPMRWTDGEFRSPAVSNMPRRLWELMPYLPVD